MTSARQLSLLLLSVAVSVLLSSNVCSCAPSRTLQVSIRPDKDPVTVPFDSKMVVSSDIHATDARVLKQSIGCQQPEQVHLTLWSDTSVLVSWASCDAQLHQTTPQPTDNVTSVVFYGKRSNDLEQRAEGVATSYAYDYQDTGFISYASPVLHHVLLKGLQPGTTYYYKVADTTVESQGDTKSKLKASRDSRKELSFKLPKPGKFPLSIGVLGDPGQTYNTSETLKRLIASDPQLLILLGDFAYADEWQNATQRKATKGPGTYQPKWDTWGRLFEPLLAKVPFMHVDGNHEIEPLPNGDRSVAYNYRYPTPQFDYRQGPRAFSAVTQETPFANLYYTVELPGVMRYIGLSSYALGQTFDPSEEQFKWLIQMLDKVDRSKTPWLIVAVHVPFYHSYAGHFKEAECFRQGYEPLFVKYGVDLVLNGHVHAYERSKPVVNYKVDECGPVYLTVGDGGNVEGVNKDFVDNDSYSPNGIPAYCSDPQGYSHKLFPQRYQPQACYSYQDGKFCPSQQPEYSAYREPSFGSGTLELQSETRAKWTWRKNQWPNWQTADEVVIYRTPNKAGCGRASARKKCRDD